MSLMHVSEAATVGTGMRCADWSGLGHVSVSAHVKVKGHTSHILHTKSYEGRGVSRGKWRGRYRRREQISDRARPRRAATGAWVAAA